MMAERPDLRLAGQRASSVVIAAAPNWRLMSERFISKSPDTGALMAALDREL